MMRNTCGSSRACSMHFQFFICFTAPSFTAPKLGQFSGDLMKERSRTLARSTCGLGGPGKGEDCTLARNTCGLGGPGKGEDCTEYNIMSEKFWQMLVGESRGKGRHKPSFEGGTGPPEATIQRPARNYGCGWHQIKHSPLRWSRCALGAPVLSTTPSLCPSSRRGSEADPSRAWHELLYIQGERLKPNSRSSDGNPHGITLFQFLHGFSGKEDTDDSARRPNSIVLQVLL